MDIVIDQEKIQEAIGTETIKAVSGALSGWKVQTAISEAIADEVLTGIVRDAIVKATEEIDSGKLATVLAGEIERAATAVVVRLLREGLADIVMKLRGKTYPSDAERAALQVELFGR